MSYHLALEVSLIVLCSQMFLIVESLFLGVLKEDLFYFQQIIFQKFLNFHMLNDARSK